jgi:hypothetical protein
MTILRVFDLSQAGDHIHIFMSPSHSLINSIQRLQLTPVILATWRQRSGGLRFKVSPGKQFADPISKKPSQKGLVEWLKV